MSIESSKMTIAFMRGYSSYKDIHAEMKEEPADYE